MYARRAEHFDHVHRQTWEQTTHGGENIVSGRYFWHYTCMVDSLTAHSGSSGLHGLHLRRLARPCVVQQHTTTQLRPWIMAVMQWLVISYRVKMDDSMA